MKVAISGKGGVGKTTLSAMLAQEAASQGFGVFAIDADPNPNLGLALAMESEPPPLVEMQDVIEERLGALEGFFRLNPRVDDLPERFSVEQNGIRLLVMGGIRQGGTGWACPENTFLRSLLQHLVLACHEWVLVDLEAGLEHLGRATAQGVDALLVVVEPDRRSIETARRIVGLAEEIGLGRVYAVGNKLRDRDEAAFIAEQLDGVETLAHLPESSAARRAARNGQPIDDPDLADQARRISNSVIADNGIAGLGLSSGAEALVQETTIRGHAGVPSSPSGLGIDVGVNSQLQLVNLRVLDNGQDDKDALLNAGIRAGLGLEFPGSMLSLNVPAQVDVINSQIDGNRQGVLVGGQVDLRLEDATVRNNGSWGLAGMTQRCLKSGLQTELEALNRAFTFAGRNVIKGNNAAGELTVEGNLGRHPFHHLPDGQVCLPR